MPTGSKVWRRYFSARLPPPRFDRIMKEATLGGLLNRTIAGFWGDSSEEDRVMAEEMVRTDTLPSGWWNI